LKRTIIIGFLFCIVFLVGCSGEQTFEDFFQQKMKEMHIGEENYSYSLVHKDFNVVQPDDAIAVFEEYDNQEEKIFIAYFEKEENQWKWKQTNGAEWHSPIKWSSMSNEPYIYSGTINDISITEVYVGEELATIINVKEDKRFWYAISPINDAEVIIVKDDGSKEIIEEINYEELQSK
jgi:hypothetical protein